MIQVNELADGHRHQWAKDMECEIIVELKDVHPHHNMTNVVKRFRLLDNRTYIAGVFVRHISISENIYFNVVQDSPWMWHYFK